MGMAFQLTDELGSGDLEAGRQTDFVPITKGSRMYHANDIIRYVGRWRRSGYARRLGYTYITLAQAAGLIIAWAVGLITWTAVGGRTQGRGRGSFLIEVVTSRMPINKQGA
jgi:hypothetical protein